MCTQYYKRVVYLNPESLYPCKVLFFSDQLFISHNYSPDDCDTDANNKKVANIPHKHCLHLFICV